jgi:hypothetical protein
MNDKVREEFEKWILDTTAWQKANMYEDKNDKNKYDLDYLPPLELKRSDGKIYPDKEQKEPEKPKVKGDKKKRKKVTIEE